MNRRVLVTGSRGWPNDLSVDQALVSQWNKTEGILTVVQGGATGADMWAKRWANKNRRELGVRPETHEANWAAYCDEDCVSHRKTRPAGETYCPRQGFIRNEKMALLGADECLAFPAVKSKGTWSMMLLCESYGIPVINLGLSDVPDWYRWRHDRQRAERM